MFDHRRLIISVGALSFIIGPTAGAQTLFDTQFRAALQEESTTTSHIGPPLGSSEQETPTAETASVITDEPYNAGHDFESGIVAAGGAVLAAVIIILLFWLVTASRHHEHE